jgi:hypothetical protein
MILNYLGLLAVAISCGMALRWGGLDERLASLGFVLATLASKLSTVGNYGSTETFLLVVDALLLVALLLLALRSDRFWPMWAAAFQLVAVTVHLASMTETGDYAWAYAVGLIFWSYPVLIALGMGTWLEGRHRKHEEAV